MPILDAAARGLSLLYGFRDEPQIPGKLQSTQSLGSSHSHAAPDVVEDHQNNGGM